MSVIYGGHAKERMKARRITEVEVEEAMENPYAETPAKAADRKNVWGETRAGRKIRITTYRNFPEFVISAVAPEEEP